MQFDSVLLPSAGSLSVAISAIYLFFLQGFFYLRKPSESLYGWGAGVCLGASLYALGQFINYYGHIAEFNYRAELVQYSSFLLILFSLTGFTFTYFSMNRRYLFPLTGGVGLLLLILLWSTDLIISRQYAPRFLLWLSKPYMEPSLGALGPWYLGLCLVYTLFILGLWIARHQRGNTGFGYFFAAFIIWFCLAVHDAYVALGGRSVLFLMEYGFFAFALAVIQLTVRSHLEVTRTLQRSEENYRNLFNSINDFICTHDLKGTILSINPVAAHSLGFDPQEVIGKRIQDFMPPESAREFGGDYVRAILKQGTAEGIMKTWNKQGKPHYIEFRNALVRTEGEAPYVIGVGRDVTQRLLADKQMRRLEDELRQAQKMEAVGTLASGIAHDFNNIMQVVSGYVQILSQAKDPLKGLMDYLPKIDSALERASELVRRILSFSRRDPVELGPVDLNENIRQSLGLLQRTLPKMVQIETRLGEGLPPVKANPTQIEQIIMNLGVNASDAMPDGGRLTIETVAAGWPPSSPQPGELDPPGRLVLLKIADTGQGMGNATLARIYEPFFTTKPAGKGTGLGLYTVFSIVQAMGGQMRCESQRGQGTTFFIHLPVHDHSPGPEVGLPEEEHGELGGDETILLVDDEESILEVGRESLESFGYQVLTAASGEDALAIYQAQPGQVAVVILDLNMPGMGGYRCLEKLLAVDPQAKVILASGYTESVQISQALEQGAAGFIPKPYRLTAIVAMIRQTLAG